MTMDRSYLSCALAVGLLLATLAVPTMAQEDAGTKAERFRANARSLGGLLVGGGSAPASSTRVDFIIERTSTDEERTQLESALRSGKRGELHRLLGQMEPVGRIIVEGELGYSLRYAREVRTADGQRILILATDRPLEFKEMARGMRSRDYDVSVVELVLDAEGVGTGTAMPAVRVQWDEASGEIILTDLSSTPVQLIHVRKTE